MTKEELKIGDYYHINGSGGDTKGWYMIVKVVGMNSADKDRIIGYSVSEDGRYGPSSSTPFITNRPGHPASALEIAWLDKCIEDGKFSPCPKEINFDDYSLLNE